MEICGQRVHSEGENGKIRISIDSEIIEHFEGLLKAVRDQNVRNYSVDVEKRDLHEYEEGS